MQESIVQVLEYGAVSRINHADDGISGYVQESIEQVLEFMVQILESMG